MKHLLFASVFSSITMLLIVQIIYNFFTFTNKPLLILNTLAMIGVLVLLNQRYLFLPFLGETVLPLSVIVESKVPENANLEYELLVGKENEGKKVIYWGAQKNDPKVIYKDPMTAYTYENAGVTTVKNGKAILKYELPSLYKINDYQLPRHLHYRICCKNDVMMGEVETIILPDVKESK